MAYDISEINTTCKVVVYNGEDQLGCAVKNSDLILIGDKEDPGPNFDETISKFAPDVIKYAEAISCSAPNAIVLVATSPVNSMMTLFSEVQRRNGTFNCDRVMGVTSVDTMRASTVLARHLNLDPEKVHLPVIGGSSPDTRIPLFSQSRPAITVCKADLRKMTRLVKMSECELLKLLKRGDALNKAFATVRLMTSVMSALGGQRNISEIVLSRTCMVPDVDYFSLPVILGPRGISHRFPIPTLTPRENILLDHAIKFIQVDKQKAVDILCSNSKFPKTPEKTKEYSDLLECDKKGLFVGALLDRLRIRKEACKPKLEYLLMCKNDAVYPPESQPSMTPKRMKFVEPDIALNDGCCPVKLPFPPSPPKRGLNAIAPKISNCKFESSPCPYPPVVKLPTTCHVCDKGTPCERFEDCKSLYGDAKCCTELPQPNCKSLMGSKSEQSVTKFTSSADHQQVASQQTSNFERAPVSLQCEQPKCNSANFSVPYTGIDTVELNSVLETPATVYPPKNVISENNCPYGLNTSSPTLGLDQTTKIRPTEDFTQNNKRDFTGTAENVHQLESVRDSSQQKCSRLDSDRLSKLQSSSASAQSQAFQNPKTLLNQEVVTHGTHLATESVQPRETMGVKNQTEPSRHDLVDRPTLLSNPPYTQSKDSGDQNQNFTSNQGTVTYSETNINGQKKSTDRSLNTPRRTLDQSIDHCLSKICFVEINTAKVKSPLAENDMRIATAEASKVASSGIPGVSDVANDQSVGQLTATVEAPKSLSGVQHSSQYNSTVSPELETTNTSGHESVTNTSKIQTALPENDKDPAETLHRNSPSTTSAVYNYSGGLGIPSKPKKKDSKMPFLYFNPWSAKREEQYYNKNSGTNAQLKNRLDREQVGEAVPNENRTGKSGATGYLEHLDVPSSENAYNGDTSARKTSEQGAEGTDSRITSSILGTKLLNSFESTRNKIGTKRKDILETSPLSSETEKKTFGDGLPKDQGINTLSSDMRLRGNIRAKNIDLKLQNNLKNIEKTKILGFGQIINKLIPTTTFSKKTELKSNRNDKSKKTVLQKLYVETHSNLLTSDHKENQGKIVMMPISSPKHIGEKTYRAKNDGGGIKNIDLQYSDISKIAHIKSKVQEALKGMIFPPKYSQKHADVVAKREKQVEQILQEKLRRASKSIKNNIREVRHVDPARASSSQKLYAPKCPSRLMFGGHPDSRVITFNNVREFDAPRVATDRIPRSGVEDHTLNIVPSEVEEPTDKSTGGEEKETTEKYQPAAQQYVVQNHVHGSDKVKQKNTGNYLPFAQHYIEQNNASDSDKPNPAVNEHYEWDRKEDLSPSTNQDYVQNLPSVQLNSAAALPFSTNEYWKHAIERHTLRANRNEAALQKLEYIIKQRSKKVTTPGSIRLARLNDPKYGMTSPNRLRFDR